MLETEQNFTYDYSPSLSELLNGSCNQEVVPSALDYIDSLGSYGVGIISVGGILTVLTFYLVTDAVYNIILQNESTQYKTNSYVILAIYPFASACSLLATIVPRSQLLSESFTQIFLTVSLYRLFLLLIDLGHRSVSKPPPMLLKVGPCCCWPCLPFPIAELNSSNLTWLRICILQLPILQSLVCGVILILGSENPLLAQVYGPYLQPLSLTSILFGIYALTVTTKSLQPCAPDALLPRRTMVSQMVLLFSKLQGFVIKNLPGTGVFPCHPPLTPQIYANLIYNCLMLVEMFMLSYAARRIYMKSEKKEKFTIIDTISSINNAGQAGVTSNNELRNIQLPVTITALASEVR